MRFIYILFFSFSMVFGIAFNSDDASTLWRVNADDAYLSVNSVDVIRIKTVDYGSGNGLSIMSVNSDGDLVVNNKSNGVFFAVYTNSYVGSGVIAKSNFEDYTKIGPIYAFNSSTPYNRYSRAIMDVNSTLIIKKVTGDYFIPDTYLKDLENINESIPVNISKSIDSLAKKIDLLDFKLENSSSFNEDVNISAIKFDHNTTQSIASKLTWVLNGGGLINQKASSISSNQIIFDNLSTIVADSSDTSFTISAYYNDSNISEDVSINLSIDHEQYSQSNFITKKTKNNESAYDIVDDDKKISRIVILKANRTPIISSVLNKTIDQASLFSYRLIGTDPDNGAILSWSIPQKPSWINTNISIKGIKTSTNIQQSFNQPYDIFIDNNDKIYIADSGNNQIKSVASDGNLITISSNQSFSNPKSIYVEDNGTIYISNTQVGSLLSLSNGKATKKIDGLNNPQGILIDSKENWWFSDTNNNSVKVLYKAGGSKTYSVSSPKGMVIDNNDTIYIATNNGVLKITSDLTSTELHLDEKLLNPSDIDIDNKGNLFLTDTGNNRVVRIENETRVQTIISNVLSVSGIALDSNNSIYIINLATNSVDKYVLEYGYTLNGIASQNDVGVHDINVSLSDGVDSSSKGFSITVNDIDVAPNLDNISNITKDEDSSAFNVIVNAKDDDGDSISFSASSSDTSKATVTMLNNTLTITPVLNAYGDVNITVNATANSKTSSKVFTLGLTPIDDAPILRAISDITKDEDSSSFNIILSAIDIEGDKVTYKAISNDTSKATVSVSNNLLTISPVQNANGDVTITVSAIANLKTTNTAFTLTLTPIDDAPKLEAIPNIIKDEDSDDFSISILANDPDGDPISYSISSSDPNKVKVSVVDKKILVKTIANANGIVNVEVNATAKGQTVTQRFKITLTSVNDAPSIDSTFNNLIIPEDKGVMNYDLNISDIEGDDISLSISSNDNTIILPKYSWINPLRLADYNNQTLDFNLTTINNANGEAKITIKAIDENKGVSSKTFNIEVSPVNDRPTMSSLSKVVVYKSSSDKNITLDGKDIDLQPLSYSAKIATANIVKSIKFTKNIMTIKPVDDISGNTDINITASDGDLNVSKVFNYMIIPIEDGDDISHIGNISYKKDRDKEIISAQINDKLKVETFNNNLNGKVSHIIDLLGKKTQANSDINGSIVKITDKGVTTQYSNNIISLEVNASLTGEAVHTVKRNGKTTKATSNIIGAQTTISKNSDGKIEVTTSVSKDNNTINVKAYEDGNSYQEIISGGVTTSVTSSIEGMETTILSSGVVESKVSSKDTLCAVGSSYVKTKVTMNTDRTTTIKLLKYDCNDNFIEEIDISPSGSSYKEGATVTLNEVNGLVEVEVTTTIDVSMTF